LQQNALACGPRTRLGLLSQVLLALGIGLLAALVLVFAIGTLLIWISLVALRVACHHYIRAVAAMVPSVSLGLRGGFRSPREVQRLMFFADNGRLMFELRSSRSFAIGERAIFSRSRHPYIQHADV
jgi:hypothetical protein